MKAPTIRVVNKTQGYKHDINLYDLVSGLANPIESGVEWAALFFDFKARELEFDIVKSNKKMFWTGFFIGLVIGIVLTLLLAAWYVVKCFD